MSIQLKKISTHTTPCNSLYSVHITSADRAFDLSRGYNRETLALIEGKWLLTEAYLDGATPRLRILACNFRNPAHAGDLLEGSFNLRAVRDAGICNIIYKGICTDCGKDTDRVDHRCGEVLCRSCGHPLRTAQEKAHRVCTQCATRHASTLYDYHHRPHRNTPLFERAHLRDSYCHIGAEIEIDHRDHFSADDIRTLSDIININPFEPFIEFERDCTIAGAECITAPTTLKGFNNLEGKINNFYINAIERGGKFGRNNGLHFHIDREFFGEEESEERAKATLMIAFLINCYYDFFKAISGREEDCFYYAQGKRGCKGIASTSIICQDHDHRDAVNLSNRATIELRFFGGHIDNGVDFLACADIVNAIARWAKLSSLAQAEKATPANIVRYINDPERVKAFIQRETPNGFNTDETDRLKADFIKALDKKIQGE